MLIVLITGKIYAFIYMLFITLTMKTKQIFLYNITIYVLFIIILYNII